MQAERKSSVQVKVIHHRVKDKKEPGMAGRRPLLCASSLEGSFDF